MVLAVLHGGHQLCSLQEGGSGCGCGCWWSWRWSLEICGTNRSERPCASGSCRRILCPRVSADPAPGVFWGSSSAGGGAGGCCTLTTAALDGSHTHRATPGLLLCVGCSIPRALCSLQRGSPMCSECLACAHVLLCPEGFGWTRPRPGALGRRVWSWWPLFVGF